MTANANLLEIAGFEHRLKEAGCAQELVKALTASMATEGMAVQAARHRLEARPAIICWEASVGRSRSTRRRGCKED